MSASFGPGTGHCFVPKDIPQVKLRRESVSKRAAQNEVLDLAKRYGSNLIIFCIGAMTPLADAVKDDADGVLRNVGGLFLQGNILSSKGTVRPDPKAFNFREDMDSANLVFETLQDTVPFTVLGKYAAYVVGITTEDFKSFSRPGLPSMCDMAKRQMELFIKSGPERFWSLYPVPEQYRDNGEWFEHLPNDVCCHPYDPLLVLCLHDIHLFSPVFIPSRTGTHVHTTVGNTPERNGIPDAGPIRRCLVGLVNAACDRSRDGVENETSDVKQEADPTDEERTHTRDRPSIQADQQPGSEFSGKGAAVGE